MEEVCVRQSAVLDDNLIDQPRFFLVAVFVTQHSPQPVALPLDPSQPPVRRHADTHRVEIGEINWVVAGADIVRSHAVRRYELHLGTARGEEVRRAWALMVPVVVIDQHLGARLDLAPEHIPDARDMLAALNPFRIRHSSGSDHHDVRRFGQNVLRFGVSVEMHGRAQTIDLRRQPLGNPEQVLAPCRPRRQHDLAAGLPGSLEDRYLMPAQRRDASGLQPRRPGSHDHDLVGRTRAAFDDMRHRPFAPGRGIVQAERIAAGIDAVKAIAGPDAGADALLLAAQHLGCDMGVGHMGASHRHHVHEPLAHAVFRRRQVRDAGGVEHRKSGLALHLGRDMHERRERPGHGRNGLGKPALVADLPDDHIQEVAHAGVGVDFRERKAVLPGQPAFLEFVADHPQTDQEILSHPAPDFLQHLETEPGAVLQAAAILVAAPVDERRPELVDEVAVGEQLRAVQPALLAAQRSIAERPHDPADVAPVHLLRKGAMRGLAHDRRRHGRQPVLHVPERAMAHMGDLAHDGAAVPMDPRGELLQHGDNGIVADIDLAEGGRRVWRNVGRPAEHGQRKPALRLLLVIELVA